MIRTKGLNFNYNNQASFSFPDINLGKDENLLIIGSSGIGKPPYCIYLLVYLSLIQDQLIYTDKI